MINTSNLSVEPDQAQARLSHVRAPFASTAPRWRRATALGEVRAMVLHPTTRNDSAKP